MFNFIKLVPHLDTSRLAVQQRIYVWYCNIEYVHFFLQNSIKIFKMLLKSFNCQLDSEVLKNWIKNKCEIFYEAVLRAVWKNKKPIQCIILKDRVLKITVEVRLFNHNGRIVSILKILAPSRKDLAIDVRS